MEFCVAWMLIMIWNFTTICCSHNCADSVRVLGLREQELKIMNQARLEARKTSCKPRAVHVAVPPAPLGMSYYPQCVSVKRCGGCCNSPLLECMPIKKTTVKKWVSMAESLHDYNNCPVRSSTLMVPIHVRVWLASLAGLGFQWVKLVHVWSVMSRTLANYIYMYMYISKPGSWVKPPRRIHEPDSYMYGHFYRFFRPACLNLICSSLRDWIF
jgi:hypothetical protein